MAVNVAINGLGRIGRAALKLILDTPELDLVAVNDIGSLETGEPRTRWDKASPHGQRLRFGHKARSLPGSGGA